MAEFRSPDRAWWGWLTWLGEVATCGGFLVPLAYNFAGPATGAATLGCVALLAVVLLRRTRSARVIVYADGTVVVRNPMRTWRLRDGHADGLGGWSNAQAPWLNRRYLTLVWHHASGQARTIRLWSVGPDLADELATALRLSVAEPRTNMRLLGARGPGHDS